MFGPGKCINLLCPWCNLVKRCSKSDEERQLVREGEKEKKNRNAGSAKEAPYTLRKVNRNLKYDSRPDSCEDIKKKQDFEQNIDNNIQLQKDLQSCYDDQTQRTFQRKAGHDPTPGMRTELDENVYHDVVLPGDVINQFLEHVRNNTRRDLETCGFLYGYPLSNIGKLVVTHLFIPLQDVTKDRCDVRDESAHAEFAITHSLILCGWIHTHPTQDNFLSERDVVNQFGYQTLLRDTVAIVCSNLNTKPKTRIYTLTSYGMAESAKKSRDSRHMIHKPHRMFKLAEYVSFNQDITVVVVDERPA